MFTPYHHCLKMTSFWLLLMVFFFFGERFYLYSNLDDSKDIIMGFIDP